MFDLGGKNALITGATGGIGGAISRMLHGAGAAVAVSGTRTERLERLAAELGDRVYPISCDLSDSESVAQLPKLASDALGTVDILVNNAGIANDSLLMRMSDEQWNKVIGVNLNSAMILSRGVLRGMMKSKWGRIINISSVVGQTGNPGQANYAASKAGLIGFAKSLAAEVASRGITVNTVSPGLIATAMTNAMSEAQVDRILTSIPVGRFGESDEVAFAVLFLASNEAAYITGNTLHVNGGLAMA
ncbi:MAG: 3-oxoacyl-[acyl-carrier-protein] reductase [Albidovulum sp.]|nr:3-oxoacyl-[acyl-carrier-protein] reductase [Albidovulum sp.]MDE0306518.1 3-oxoacyl-[acyl-carrier-protein] reductase [Albidovulum sp.]MDE0531222.1 3-oxoacyl-[acyl-carrier-protein] reductase [Albidovulum sp.]